MEFIFVSIICLLVFFSFKVLYNSSSAFPVILGLCIVFQDLRFTQLEIESKAIFLAVAISLFFARKRRITSNIASHLGRNKSHERIFLLLICFLITQSIRGSLVYWRGITSFYWAAHFLAIGYIGAQRFAGKYIFPDNLTRVVKVRCIVTYSLCAYTSIVLLLKLLPEVFFTSMNIINPSNTVLFFPITLLLPVMILSMKDGGKCETLCAIAGWAFAFVWCVIASSRGALVPFLVITFMGYFYLIGTRNVIKSLVSFLLFAMLVGGLLIAFYSTDFVQTGVQTSLDGLQVMEIFQKGDLETIRDLDRALHVQAAWDSIKDNWLNFLFGYGYRVSGLILAPRLDYLYATYLPHLDFASELGDVYDVVTFGFSSMAVDFGFVGIFGFIALFLVIANKILKRTRGLWRAILLVNLSFIVLRLYGNNFLSYPLLYLALSPCGVFMYMINYYRIINGVQQRRAGMVPRATNRRATAYG